MGNDVHLTGRRPGPVPIGYEIRAQQRPSVDDPALDFRRGHAIQVWRMVVLGRSGAEPYNGGERGMSGLYSSTFRRAFEYARLAIVLAAPGPVRAITRRPLTGLGIKTVHECSGEREVWRVIGHDRVDLIFYSNELPTDGVAFCQAVRRRAVPSGLTVGDAFDPEVPIIVLDGSPDGALRRDAQLVGASMVIEPPADRATVGEVLDTVLADQSQLRGSDLLYMPDVSPGPMTWAVARRRGALVVTLTGHLCAQNRQELEALLARLSAEPSVSEVVCNLDGLAEVDPYGLGTLVCLHSVFEAGGVKFTLVAGVPAVRRRIAPLMHGVRVVREDEGMTTPPATKGPAARGPAAKGVDADAARYVA